MPPLARIRIDRPARPSPLLLPPGHLCRLARAGRARARRRRGVGLETVDKATLCGRRCPGFLPGGRGELPNACISVDAPAPCLCWKQLLESSSRNRVRPVMNPVNASVLFRLQPYRDELLRRGVFLVPVPFGEPNREHELPPLDSKDETVAKCALPVASSAV